MLAKTPTPPYYAVIFSSIRSEKEPEAYAVMAKKMYDLAHEQPGFLGVESAREEVGITVSYWKDVASIKQWKQHTDHMIAQQLGKEKWYKAYTTRICKVEREYGIS
jgi:heme-degrading monooxygenase HmoA